VQGITPIVSAPATIKARSPQKRPQSRQFSPKVAVQQAVSPISEADRNGSAAVASLHSSESENSESNSALPVTAASLSTAGTIWRKLLLVSMLFRTVKLSLQQLYQSVAPDNAIVHLKQLKWDDIS